MDIKDAIAIVDFKECYIPHISIDNDFSNLTHENCSYSLNIQNGVTDINDMTFNESTGHIEANLILDLTVTAVSNHDSSRSCKVHIVLNGLFDYSGTDKNEFYYMLLINGNSTLYSIARSHIITLTALSSTSGRIVLPMVNFVKILEEAKNKKTSNQDQE